MVSDKQCSKTKNHLLTANISTDALISLYRSDKINNNFDSLITVQVECDNKALNTVVDTATQISIIKSTIVPIITWAVVDNSIHDLQLSFSAYNTTVNVWYYYKLRIL